MQPRRITGDVGHHRPASRRRALGGAILLGLLLPGLLLPSCAAPSRKEASSGETGGGGAAVPPEDRATLDRYWKLYVEDDPGWPEAREAWLAMGEPARFALVASLIRDLVVGTSSNDTVKTERAGVELVRLGPVAVPALLEAGRQGDGILRQQTAEILTYIGSPAVDALVASVESGGDNRFRRYEIEVLGRIGDDRAFPAVRKSLLEDGDWANRAAAATALAGLGDSRAVPDLDRALRSDADAFVRERAAAALGSFQDSGSVQALVEGMEREARRSGENALKIVQACGRSLRAITGEDLPAEPAVWGEWWARHRLGWRPPDEGSRGR